MPTALTGIQLHHLLARRLVYWKIILKFSLSMKLLIQVILVVLVNLSLAKLIQESGYSPHRMNEREIISRDRRISLGDSLVWADPEYDDRHWSTNPYLDTNAQFWLRETLILDERLLSDEPIGLAVNLLASYELYWDGHLLGTNGHVGSNKSLEIQGQHFKAFILPDSLATMGAHTLAFRSSNFYLKNKIRPFGTWAGVYEDLIRKPITFSALIHVLGGIFLVIGLYYLFIFFINYQQLAYLLFGFLCLLFFVLTLFEYLKFHYWYPYSYHYVRLEIIEYLTLFFNGLLLLFFLIRFNFPKMGIVFGLLVLMLSLIKGGILPYSGHDIRIIIMSMITFYASSLIILRAYFLKKSGSKEALLGIIPCLFLFVYYDLMLFLSFSNLVLFNLLSFSYQQKKMQKEQQTALLRSARLETELLKKNIQPHYLMNTLTSLLEWVEKDPKIGAHFIQALADEFKMLNRISDKKLIPLNQEIELCQAHLHILSFRKGKKYFLETIDVPENLFIPPALILTLVENGITHNRSVENKIVQKLKIMQHPEFIVFTVQSLGPVKNKINNPDGTGFKYVKARLEESYPGNWEFSSKATDYGWESIIRIFQKNNSND